MQLQADLLGCPVKRVKVQELSAFGAGLMAGVAAGLMDEAKVEANLNQSSDVINAHLDKAAREDKVRIWSDAVRSVITNSEVRRSG
jgi:glycerol kinase